VETPLTPQVMGVAGASPPNSPVHRLSSDIMGDGIRQALVECHDDVASQRQLDIDRAFRREEVLITIQVRSEQHAVFRYFAKRVQTKHLETAGIGQDGAVPSHKLVQSSEALDAFMTRPEKQMISVSENDARVKILFEIARGERFYGALSADWHEHRRFNDSVRGMQQTCAGTGLSTLRLYLKTESGHPLTGRVGQHRLESGTELPGVAEPGLELVKV